MKTLNVLLEFSINQIKPLKLFQVKLSWLLQCKYFVGFVALLLLLGVKSSQAQYAPDYRYPDSVFVNSHSPNKATFYSAILPGMGQIYNKKYWKVPIIYAGFAGLLYYTNYTNYVYNKYKDSYNIKLRIEAGEVGLDDVEGSAENLRRTKDTWKRYRDMNLIGFGVLYVAQILDASVDAHLFDYDVSQDLSMRVQPTLLPNVMYQYQDQQSQTLLGVTCAIKF